jgi:hypothetical protein
MAKIIRFLWPFVLRSEHERVVTELRQAHEQERIRRIMAESKLPIQRVPGREPWE